MLSSELRTLIYHYISSFEELGAVNHRVFADIAHHLRLYPFYLTAKSKKELSKMEVPEVASIWGKQKVYYISALHVVVDLRTRWSKPTAHIFSFTWGLQSLTIEKIQGRETNFHLPASLRTLIIRRQNIIASQYYEELDKPSSTLSYIRPGRDGDEELLLPRIPVDLILEDCSLYTGVCDVDIDVMKVLACFRSVTITNLSCHSGNYSDNYQADEDHFYEDVLPVLLKHYPNMTYCERTHCSSSDDE